MSGSSQNAWDELHKSYSTTDWINKPNIFAEQVLAFLSKGGKLLDVGAGQGQDSRFFASKGFKVTAVDISDEALKEAAAKSAADSSPIFINANIANGLKFEDESFDVVYAHLSLHYFDSKTTDSIFRDISRVLKPGGIFAFFVNSTNDPEYEQGEKLEEDYYLVDGNTKRYFSVQSAQAFANKYFKEILADKNGETYKDAAKGIHNLIRYIGIKQGESNV